MTARKDPAVERQVQTFMYQVERHDNILRLCRKPTTRDQAWEGGYRAGVLTVLEVMTELLRVALDRDRDEPALWVLRETATVAASAARIREHADDLPARWAEGGQR